MNETPHYPRATAELRLELSRAISVERLRDLTHRRPLRHFLVVARMVVLLAAGVTGSALFNRPFLWIPCAVVSGFTIFGFTILLHEVVHNAVFDGKPAANVALGWLYAFPSGLSRSQFSRWHKDHHAELGDPLADPKRHHLSPKRNARWLKALYFTPALFVIYFRAAARETATYSAELRRRVRRERVVTVGGQLLILATLIAATGWWIAFKVYMVPYFIVFPVAFVTNRLGQHYDIDPADPARWSTLMAPSRLWDFAFLWSSYHLEHHYFPSVPFYNLRALHVSLRPFYAQRGMVGRTYGQLLWQWLVQNRPPHANWEALEAGPTGSAS